ncbi:MULTISPECIES: dienelactone hydrolase family protein [unclassified Acinetobacter]|uniref:dienelactone hydrolase family protein n=1 Tax=unclassified Acinetobacter TaxID=196816 RepID=UPI0025769F1C|nr:MULTISPECIES: dienelactone hydrolase family protein [unclassified Acinetobacter]MDM1758242.1 dienelactone hydrolase family protein [Acinetobacter sp. 256-1]MDM1760593.1 dienelactone hydrolase family protein [Acinetobacter sp. 251-1]
MSGKYIQVTTATGNQYKAYLATSVDGKGPGIVLCQEIFGVNQAMRDKADLLAEEGYSVLVPDLYWRIAPETELGYGAEDFQRAFELYQQFDEDLGVQDIEESLAFLKSLDVCDDQAQQAVVGFCLGGKLAYLAACRIPNLACSVAYYGVGIEKALAESQNIQGKLLLHMAELDQFCPENIRQDIQQGLAQIKGTEVYVYPQVDHAFARPRSEHFDKTAAQIAHERTVAALRKTIGPDYDLAALWEEHIRHEFDTRDVPATMATMVAEPYVNHIPTMTGGVGYKQLSRFYQHHFVHQNPKDMSLIPISRTVGATQVVDEFIMSFTHDEEIDWLIPGIAPTGKKVQIPMLGVIKFRGPKLCHEHIYWDQASVLVQLGVLNPQGLPVAGVETAQKLIDESLPSNTLMPSWSSSEKKSVA